MLQWECSEGRGGREQDMGYWAERARRASAPYPTTERTALMHACVFVSVWGRERERGGEIWAINLLVWFTLVKEEQAEISPPCPQPITPHDNGEEKWGLNMNPGLWVYRSDWSHAGRFRTNQGGWWREWAGPTIRPFPTALRHPDGRAPADWGFSSPSESERETAILKWFHNRWRFCEITTFGDISDSVGGLFLTVSMMVAPSTRTLLLLMSRMRLLC